MTKIITWIIIVGAVATGGYFALTPRQATLEDVTTLGQKIDTTPSSLAPAETGKKMAFSEFIKSGGSYQCTVSQEVGGISSDGKIYIDGDKIHGEFNSTVNGLNVDSHLIVRDGYTYSWSSMTPSMGFKVKAVAPEEANTNTATKDTYSFNAEQIGEYSCDSWAVDAKMFELPTNIKFQELGA